MVEKPPTMQKIWVEKIPWRKAWQLTPVFLLGESPWIEEPGRLLQSMGLQRVRHHWLIKHSTVYTCQCYFLNLFHSLHPLLHPQVHSLHPHLHSFPENRFISSIFLGSIYIHYIGHVFFFLYDFTSLFITDSRSIYLTTTESDLFFLCLSDILLYMCTTFSYPFIYQWTAQLLPYPGYCK